MIVTLLHARARCQADWSAHCMVSGISKATCGKGKDSLSARCCAWTRENTDVGKDGYVSSNNFSRSSIRS